MIIESEFSDTDLKEKNKRRVVYPFESSKKCKRVLLFWREHCHECAPPVCYSNCKNYLKRSDGKCQLIEHGISRISISGSLHYCLKFRKWAKIETISSRIIIPKSLELIFDIVNSIAVKIIKKIPFRSIKLKTLNIFVYSKERILRAFVIGRINNPISDIALFSNESKDYNLIIESRNYKRSILIQPGANSFLFKLPKKINRSSIKWFPENDKLASLYLKRFDIVENCYCNELNMLPKLVVWDLDNTLWDGVLIEGKIGDLKIRKNIVWTIKYLDSIGVVNSVCSKNDFNNAKAALEHFEIWEYFVFPEINWNSKSENVKKILNSINLDMRNIIVIDDNPFERAEISTVFPEIKIFDENAFPNLLKDISFIELDYNLESSNRRELYKTEKIRTQVFDKLVTKNNSIVGFLKSCNIVIEISNFGKDISENIMLRCNELMSRTNQLNISGVKFDDHEFNQLVCDESDKFYFSVSDSFGSYGIVGFLNCSIIENTIKIHNLVISCRVAKKLIENSLVNGLLAYYKSMGIKDIVVEYNKTDRNTPIYESFLEMGFITTNGNLICDSANLNDCSNIIKIRHDNSK